MIIYPALKKLCLFAFSSYEEKGIQIIKRTDTKIAQGDTLSYLIVLVKAILKGLTVSETGLYKLTFPLDTWLAKIRALYRFAIFPDLEISEKDFSAPSGPPTWTFRPGETPDSMMISFT